MHISNSHCFSSDISLLVSSVGSSIPSSFIMSSRHSIFSWRSFYPLQILSRAMLSGEIRDIIPGPLRRVRTTRSSTHSHPFRVSLPNPRTLSHKSSFIPRTWNLWNVLPSSCFPESYNLQSIKSMINKLDLISLT